MRSRRLAAALALSMLTVVGCGSASTTTVTVHNAATAPVATTASPSQMVAAGGCGAACQQAGPGAGGPPQSGNPYYCPPRGCNPCPPAGCLIVLARSAAVTGGAFTVPVRCRLSTACDGVFLVFQRGWIDRAHHAAASEFVVPAGQQARIGIALTPLGRRLLPRGTSYLGDLDVFLKGGWGEFPYGQAGQLSQTFRLDG